MIKIDVLKAAVMDSRDGITISDFALPDNPLIFINPAFERMTGYSLEEVIGKNCRYLQGSDTEQESQLIIIRDAIKNRQPCLVTLRNYRKDGAMFWNELSMSPIFDSEGELTHYIGIQKDVTDRVLAEEKTSGEYSALKKSNIMLERLVNIDPLTGVYNRRYLEEQLHIQWKIAQRQKNMLTIFMLDIDYFKKYNDSYGHQAGDAVLKSVAKVLSNSFLKSTDFVARYGGEEFIILTLGSEASQVAAYADLVIKKVSDLSIKHSGSENKILTISAGFSSCWPDQDLNPADIIKQADKALYKAKASGRNKAIDYAAGNT